MESPSSTHTTVVYLSSILLWIISAAVGIVAALIVRSALMAFYTGPLASIINPWSIHIVGNIVLLLVILAWLILAMIGHEYYRLAPTFGILFKRFVIVMVVLGAVIGLGFLVGLEP